MSRRNVFLRVSLPHLGPAPCLCLPPQRPSSAGGVEHGRDAVSERSTGKCGGSLSCLPCYLLPTLRRKQGAEGWARPEEKQRPGKGLEKRLRSLLSPRSDSIHSPDGNAASPSDDRDLEPSSLLRQSSPSSVSPCSVPLNGLKGRKGQISYR